MKMIYDTACFKMVQFVFGMEFLIMSLSKNRLMRC